MLKLRQDGAFTEQRGSCFLHFQKFMIDFDTSVLNFIVFSVFISSFNFKKGACNDGTSCPSWRWIPADVMFASLLALLA